MRSARNYEPGMRIVYDPVRGIVTVSFRGKLRVLQDTYGCEDDGRDAAEAYCRRMGWNPEGAKPVAGRSLLSYRRAS